jgi:pilus assembly protein CpaE
MTELATQVKVLTFVRNSTVINQIATALRQEPKYTLLENIENVEGLVQTIDREKPNIFVMDIVGEEDEGLALIDELTVLFPEVAILPVLSEDQNNLVQAVMLAGARGFILQPFTQVELVKTFNRVIEILFRFFESTRTEQPTGEAVGEKRQHGTVVVFSPRGGVGCTTVASNLALAVWQRSNRETLLMDGKQFFGHLDVFFNVRAQNSIADLIPHISELDPILIRDVVIEHASGLKLLLGPNSMQVAQGVRPDDLYTMALSIQKMYPFFIIDGGHTISENVVTLLDLAYEIILVINPDLASLKDTREFFEVCKTLAYSKEKVQVVLNRANMPGAIRVSEIESALGAKLFAKIPNQEAEVLRSINRGVPLLYDNPKSKVSKAINNLGGSLLDHLRTQMSSEFISPLDSKTQDALAKSSRLG